MQPSKRITASRRDDRFADPAKLRQWLRPFRRRLRKLNSLRIERETLAPPIRATLANSFRDDIDLPGRTLGRDLSHWVGRDE